MNPYLRLLYQALTFPLGIVVEHENPQSARSQFYAARKKQGDPALDRISVTILDDHPNRLYLIHSKEAPPCPAENPPPSLEPTSGSTTTTSDGSVTLSDLALVLPKLSEP